MIKKPYIALPLALVLASVVQAGHNTKDLAKAIANQKITIIPEATVLTYRGKHPSFTCQINKQGDGWTSSRYPGKHIHAKFKLRSTDPVTFTTTLKKDHVRIINLIRCPSNHCGYATVIFGKDGLYQGASIGKMVFRNKEVFKSLT